VFSLIEIQPITLQNIAVFKEVRLRALREDPYAFGSTYAREAQFTDTEWAQRLNRWNGELGVGYLAIDKLSACGIAGSLLDENDATHAQLVSMWTAPTHRKSGVGRLLVDAVLNWAKSRNVRTLSLMVVGNNEPAIRFYERLSFARTGRTEPYPNDTAILEYEMSRPVSS